MLGLVGKSNTGKSTFFSAATLINVEISNRIFTTIEPNKGVSYVRTECPCKILGIKCAPKNSLCIDGQRFVPVQVIDIAGLVPGAYECRGLGNKFLSDIMGANALIHVLDMSGGTDNDGNPVAAGSHDPEKDIYFLEDEIDYWILGLLEKNWNQIKQKAMHEKIENLIYKQLSGLNMSSETVKQLVEKHNITAEIEPEKLMLFIKDLRQRNKPIILVGNKMDVFQSQQNFEKMKNHEIIPCYAEAELALRRAADKGFIKYIPGDSGFEIIGNTDDRQKQALGFIKKYMEKYKTTGIQDCINKAVFDVMKMIVVYPVENESRFSDKKGNILPNAKLMPSSSTAVDMAYAVHEDIGRNFISAVDCRIHQRIGSEHQLKTGDIISIKSRS